MGILSDRDIRWKLEPEGGLVIRPEPKIIQPTSVDLHLHDVLRLSSWPTNIVDPANGIGPEQYSRVFNDYHLHPGGFVLGATREWIEIPPGLVGILMGKSSLARPGLQIESAGYVDPGWKGRLTLEIINLGEHVIILRPDMPICQIRFETLYMNECERLYGDPALNSHYQGATGPQSARLDRPSAEPDPEIGTPFSELDPG